MADDNRATTWFVPLERPPYVAERHGADGPPADLRVLEISSRSRDALGRSLSAMYLREPESGQPVEAVYQAAKCYGEGGPAEVLDDGFRSKTRDRERALAGPLSGFQHKGTFWPIETGTQFYDRLWMLSARAAGVGATDHDAFTDMFHRRGRSMACQARTMAMMQGMLRSRGLDVLDDPVAFSDAVEGDEYGMTAEGARDEVRVVVSGSPKYANRDAIYRKLDEIRERIGEEHGMRVVHGDRKGLDRTVQAWAKETGVEATEVPEDWDRNPRSAGYARNEEMLDDHDPHLVVLFPDYGGKGPRHLQQSAHDRELAVEVVVDDGRETWTETLDGKLVNLSGLADELGRTQLVSKIGGPGPLAAASLRNGDPETDGEIRIVVAPGPGRENERAVRAKLENIQERAQPAALRLAIAAESAVGGSVSEIARKWATERCIRVDMYLRDASGDEAGDRASRATTGEGHEVRAARQPGQGQGGNRTAAIPGRQPTGGSQFERMLAEQDPDLVLTGRSTAPGFLDRTERAGVHVETITAGGWTRTTDGTLPELGDEEHRFRGQARPNPIAVKTYPGQSAAEAAERLRATAAESEWATAETHERRAVNLRDTRAGDAVRVDRRTEWGNPFPLRRGADDEERKQVIDQYVEYLARRIDNGQMDIAKLAALSGRKPACHCAPAACHGDALASAADWTAEREREREERERPPKAAERPDPLIEEGGGSRETVDIDEIPPWDGSEDLAPDEAAERHAWQPGVSDIEPLNRRREALARQGATEEELTRYDDAVWEFEQGMIERQEERREPAGAAEHPLTKDIERAGRHLEEMREAGATEKQIARLEQGIESVRAERDRQLQRDETERGARGEEIAGILERMSAADGPLGVAAEIEAAIVERGPKKTGRPRPRVQELRPVAPAPEPASEPTREVRVLVCGSRNLDDANVVRAKLDSVRERIGGAPMRVVLGDGRGADEHALRWATDAGVPADVYEADWKNENRSAGYRRNERMLEETDAHLLVAFPRNEDTPLAEHVIIGCNEREIPIETVDERGVSHTSTPKPVDLAEIGRRTEDERRIAGTNVEDLDPVEYAARMTTASAAGEMDEEGRITARTDARQPAPSPPPATEARDGGATGSAHER